MLELIVGIVVVVCCVVLYVWWGYDREDRVWVEVDNEWWFNQEVRGLSHWEG